MRTLPILFIVLSFSILSSCGTSNKLTFQEKLDAQTKSFKERRNARSEALYLRAISYIEDKDYIRAYYCLDSSYASSTKKATVLPKIRNLIAGSPGVVAAIADNNTAAAFQREIKKSKYKNKQHAMKNIARKIKLLKIIHPQSSGEAVKNFRDYFKDTPENFLAVSKKEAAERYKKRKSKVKKGNSFNIKSKGNLAVTKPILCVDISTLTSSHTPADIFTGLSDCIKKNEVRNAVRLYALALSYGRYDSLRMIDKTARGAMRVLRFQTFASASKEYKLKFTAEKKKQDSTNLDKKEFSSLCKDIKNLGKPSYHPDYMIRHGMAAFTGKPMGVLSDFNAEDEWEKVMSGFLKCS